MINISSAIRSYHQPQSRQAVFFAFFGSNSRRNIGSYVPHTYTQIREIAKLFTIAAALRHVLKIIQTSEFVRTLVNICEHINASSLLYRAVL